MLAEPLGPMRSSGLDSDKFPVTIRNSDETRWFLEKVQTHDGQLKAYLRSAYPNARDIDDVVQESYLRVWQRHLSSPIVSAKNFLFSVARHLVIDRLRNEKASPIEALAELQDLPVLDDMACVTEGACTQEEVALLLEAIDALPSRCREILILRKLQGVSQKEIARRLGLSEQTVQVQVGRGTRRCEKFMRERGVIRSKEA